jgi:hypothetical protein
VHPEQQAAFETAMSGNCFAVIGTVTAEQTLVVSGLEGACVVRSGLAELKEAWQSTLREM